MEEQPGAVLVVEQGVADLTVIDLDQDALVLGKVPEVEVTLDNPYVSRRHAEISLENKGYVLRDLGSKNGTFVNGAKVRDEGQLLKNGDRIELAPGQVILRFESRSGTMTLPAFGSGRFGDLAVDARSREVLLNSRKIEPPLSRKEFDVLHYLYEHRGEACNKDSIAAHGWPDRETGDVSDQEIEQCIRRLRLRIEPDPSRPRYVLTVRGFGYKLSQD